jgi:hypothetical protein
MTAASNETNAHPDSTIACDPFCFSGVAFWSIFSFFLSHLRLHAHIYNQVFVGTEKIFEIASFSCAAAKRKGYKIDGMSIITRLNHDVRACSVRVSHKRLIFLMKSKTVIVK